MNKIIDYIMQSSFCVTDVPVTLKNSSCRATTVEENVKILIISLIALKNCEFKFPQCNYQC